VILTSMLRGFLHETTERWEHIDRRIYLLIVQLPINKDLSLRDVTSKVRNGMSYIVILSRINCTGIERMGI
jgi:hypothetical protein